MNYSLILRSDYMDLIALFLFVAFCIEFAFRFFSFISKLALES